MLDYSTPAFVSYIVGARSRSHPVPHAGDALFAVMLEKARAAGCDFVQLGLGVNEGITRFKRKWGGTPQLSYVMAQWQERPRADVHKVVLDELMQALVERSDEGLSKRQILDRLPDQRPFAMLWELEKQGRRSWICGTAHFFCYSFADSFRRLFRKVDTVIFEGPLDAESLAQVEACGKSPDPGAVPLDSLMTEAEIRRLERVVCGVRGPVARFLNMEWEDAPDVRERLHTTRHWYAFFSLWTAFLERQGWRDSVDLEAWHLARDMGKTVLGMETMEEQLHSLEVVPVPRVLDFFRHCGQWRSYMKRNIYHYLRGELEPMMGTSTEFPTRTQQVIDALRTTFRLPGCSKKFPRDIGRERPCLNHHIGRCDGFCRPDGPGQAEYQARIRQAVRIFSGHYRQLTAELQQEMEQAAEELNFEKAAALRDRSGPSPCWARPSRSSPESAPTRTCGACTRARSAAAAPCCTLRTAICWAGRWRCSPPPPTRRRRTFSPPC